METTVKERLIKFLSYKNIGQNKFEKEIGISNGYISNIKSSIGSNILTKILNVYNDLNITWLLTGKGEMLISADEKQPVEGVPCINCAQKDAEILKLKDKIIELQERLLDGGTERKKINNVG